MTKSDDAILELLKEAGIAIPPTAVSFNISNVSKPTIDRRLPKLEKAGLVKRHDEPRGYTEITPLGEAYLKGDLSESDVQSIEELAHN